MPCVYNVQHIASCLFRINHDLISYVRKFYEKGFCLFEVMFCIKSWTILRGKLNDELK